jgi:non-ribosomal peptide synthetase-like protein
VTLFDHSISTGTTTSAVEPLLLHQFFERSAREHPDRIAIDVPPGFNRAARKQLTYSQVERQANLLASFLREFVYGETIVAILLPRSEWLYLSQLGVLKSGGAYTCIDPEFPDEQARAILEDSEAVVLLTNRAGIDRARRLGYDRERCFDVASLIDSLGESVSAIEPPVWLTPANLAYLIYTSGTTGRPKGVMIEHRSIVNLISSDVDEFGLSPDDRVSQNSSAAYDSSVEEMWLAFGAAATLVVMDEDTARLGPDLISWLRRERITVLCPPPTLLRATGCNDPQTALPDLEFLYLGGEALPSDVADRWAPGRRLVNGYGPTECAVTALRERIIEGDPITIGTPIRGLDAWVLNDSLEEVTGGERGELCIGGIGLARGYHKRPELTARKFPEHPRLGRIYRTGDLVHRDSDGRFFYHGRIDSQVKLRGYRIELEAIEARLVEYPGVREAACRVQGTDSHQTLVAFVVLDNCQAPSFADLKESLLKTLPSYMVPTRFATIASLPTTVGGKLNRGGLPVLETDDRGQNGASVSPRNEIERRLERAFAEVLNSPVPISIHDDFFNDLAGDSLSAAELISLLRGEASTAQITVRDLYESRTIAELAKHADQEEVVEATIEQNTTRRVGSPLLATGIQIGWLLGGLMIGSSLAYLLAFDLLPVMISKLGLVPLLLLSPFLTFAALLLYTPLAVLLSVLVKKVLVGRYQPLRAPVWGSFYVRNWMVQQTVRIVPWALLQGTEFQVMALRALGARIGKRVHIHRGVGLLDGGWDLLEIGDDVTISQDASIRLVDFDNGDVVVNSIVLGDRCTLDVRSGVSGNTVLENESYLTALSFLPAGGRVPRGGRWDGIPAEPAGQSPARPDPSPTEKTMSPIAHGILVVLAKFGLALLVTLPLELLAVAFVFTYGFDSASAVAWLDTPSLDPAFLLPAILIATVPGPFALAFEALMIRALGEIREEVISRWSVAYIRVLLKTRMVQNASDWLSGTLFWPMWLRLAGMKIGRDCEISTIIDVVPELIEIGPESFLADGIYLGGPRVHRGTVTLARTTLGPKTFIGNHAVISAGQRLPEDILVGVSTAVDEESVQAGTSWFGHPAFELPRREVVEVDRSLTHNPSFIRYVNRIFWEALRSALPVFPFLVFPLWFDLLSRADAAFSRPVFLFTILPVASLAIGASFCVLVLVLKWVLLGRVRPGTHPLWSCWCSRWDFLYVAWAVYASRVLAAVEGTLLLSWYLRAMGMRIGHRVVLGRGFTQVVDPDMLEFEDGATVSCQFQAHTFEDRVLKIGYVRISNRATVGTGAVLLYGADIGARTHVAPHSVVMKREALLADRSYAGCPTRPVMR